MRPLFAASVLSLALLGPRGLAAADPAPPEPAPGGVDRIKAAAEEFDAGRRAFLTGDFAKAAEHFENADRDVPSPEAIRMAIRARKSARHDARAATLAGLALQRYPDDQATAAVAQQTLTAVQTKLHRLTVKCTPTCTLGVDGHVAPWAETDHAVIYLDPGEHTIDAGWSQDRSRSSQLLARAGASTEMVFDAPALPETAPEPDASSGPASSSSTSAAPSALTHFPPTVFFVVAGTTAVMGAVTLWSGIDTISNPGKDRVRADCAGKDDSCPTYQDALSSQHRTNILLGVSAVLAVATGVVGVFLTDWSGGESSSSSTGTARVVPSVSVGSGLQLGASGRF